MTVSSSIKVPAISEDEFKEIERSHYHDSPEDLIHSGLLTIKTKDEGLKKLVMNNAQKIFMACLKKIRGQKKPVRVLLLKARQMGLSTITEALLFCNTSQKEGINSLVIADDIKGSNYIFEMEKLFYDQLDGHLKPGIKHSNEKKLEFDGIHSQVLIDTAENKDVGRKMTLQYVHISEAAFFSDLGKIMLGLNQSVPAKEGTMIVLESTANGVGGAFYDMWESAKKGESEWRCIFIGWHELPEYSMPVGENGMYPIDSVKQDKRVFLDEENKLRQRFKLRDSQLNWRRWCIVNNCQGDVRLFHQEYPSDDVEAFLLTGSCFFDKDGLLKQEEKKRLWLSGTKDYLPRHVRIGNIVKVDNRYIFREGVDGRYRLYEFPDEDSTYVVAADAAEGLPHGDDSAMVVLNKRTNRVALVMNCKADSDELADDCVKAGHYFNMAMVAPENKGYGSEVCKKVYKVYGNVYRRIKDKTGSNDVTDELGWNTNVSTRPQMLEQIKEEVRENAVDILDDEILGQMKTFINDPKKKKPLAESGKKDDLVIALAISSIVRAQYPHVSRKRIDSARRHAMGKRKMKPNQGIMFKKGD